MLSDLRTIITFWNSWRKFLAIMLVLDRSSFKTATGIPKRTFECYKRRYWSKALFNWWYTASLFCFCWSLVILSFRRDFVDSLEGCIRFLSPKNFNSLFTLNIWFNISSNVICLDMIDTCPFILPSPTAIKLTRKTSTFLHFYLSSFLQLHARACSLSLFIFYLRLKSLWETFFLMGEVAMSIVIARNSRLS